MSKVKDMVHSTTKVGRHEYGLFIGYRRNSFRCYPFKTRQRMFRRRFGINPIYRFTHLRLSHEARRMVQMIRNEDRRVERKMLAEEAPGLGVKIHEDVSSREGF